ncbi:DNA repair protein RadA [Bacteroidota bacterium]|nr:DNA repair protein RadA [Bacteroidota bacterium]MEC8005208.1 DNA repair protein RadA [Bacteroidota bacterium]
MSKSKSVFVCQSCGQESPKWTGKCSGCNEWNTLVEQLHNSSKSKQTLYEVQTKKAIPVSSINEKSAIRLLTNDEEFNRVVGGGLVSGSVTLLAGEPGIGKSTLTLKLALSLNKTVLYVTGEESAEQIKLRAKRLKDENKQCYVLNESKLENVISEAEKLFPELLIIDSVQTLSMDEIDSVQGSTTQIRHCAEVLIKYAKTKQLPTLIIGHVTKDGSIAGPKILEHMVDTVLQFEGDKNHLYRIVRSTKNRFGNTNEIGIYEMFEDGLKGVKSPNKLLISENTSELSGIAIGCSLEGIRPIMIEIQALSSTATYGTPQRSFNGLDGKRLNMLLAVLEKRGGLKLSQKDIFINVTGGIKINDPAIDLAIICAVLSSNFDFPIPQKTCFIGEVGLSGEIRPVSRINERIKEVVKMGAEYIFVSKYAKLNKAENGKYQIKKVVKVQEIIQQLIK